MAERGSAHRDADGVPRAVSQPGELGNYRLLAKLGAGGQADVYLALSQGPMNLKRLVVLKRLRSAFEYHEEYITMFLDEARLAARLAHPNVVHTYEVGRDGDAYFIAMEYLDGQSIDSVMRHHGASKLFTPRMWATIAAEALSGLHYAHELTDYDGTPLGIVHRDVSPHNVFLTYDGEVKLVDFGIAKASLNTIKTETGVIKGKVTYMSPEQARGIDTDRRSDLFAMGVILWEAVTGRRLFVGDPLQVLHRLLNDPIPAPSTIRPEVAPELEAIIVRALAKAPEDRFQDAEEMRKALDVYINGSGERLETADLGCAVTSLFGDLRASVKRQITAQMANAGAGSPSEILALTASNRNEPTLQELSAVQVSPTAAPVGSMPARSREGDGEGERATPTSSRRLFAAMGLGLVAAGLLAAATLRLGGEAARESHESQGLALPPPPVPELQIASLSLVTDPAGASVAWSGHAMGRTPMRLDLPPGPQTLIVSKDGFDDETLVVDLAAGTGVVTERALTLRVQAPIASAARATPPARTPAPKGALAKPPPANGASGVNAPAQPSQGASAQASPASPGAPSPASSHKLTPKENW